jgi:hypothetical protein
MSWSGCNSSTIKIHKKDFIIAIPWIIVVEAIQQK